MFKFELVLVAIAVLVTQGLMAPGGYAQTTTFTTAMYYDKNNNLLQIEDLAGVNLDERLVQEIGNFRIPRMVTQTNSELGVPCPAENATQLLSRSASHAIYYGVTFTSDSSEFARPLGLEWLQEVSGRSISCQQIKNTTPCASGYHCLTGCVGCPSWCCVR